MKYHTHLQELAAHPFSRKYAQKCLSTKLLVEAIAVAEFFERNTKGADITGKPAMKR
jgi:hypothetical protein